MKCSPYVKGAAFLYACLLLTAWIVGGLWQDRASEKLLRSARKEFEERIHIGIRNMQWYQASLVFDELGGTSNATARSVNEMRAIADRFYIDEFNIVNSNGVVVASNLPQVIGDDWHDDVHTAAFLDMLCVTSRVGKMIQPLVAQQFRHGSTNPDYYCAYFGLAYMDRSGIIEVGYSIDRLMAVLAYTEARAFRRWAFGREGHFSAIDADGDTVPDIMPHDGNEARFEEGMIDRIEEEGERAYRLTFAFAGRLFAATVPYREFGKQRIMAFGVAAITSAALILVFAIILMRLAHARRHVEALRREADERQARDMAIARKIQMSSLPRAEDFAPAEREFGVEAMMRPAREVGGDYYDFFSVSPRVVAFVIGDVSGKGVPAAMFMQEAKHAFGDALARVGTLGAAVEDMNAALCAQNDAEMFVTAWFGLLDLTTGEMEYVNAGHNRPFVVEKGGEVRRVDERGGRLIGMFNDARYHSTKLKLRAGDRLVLYTDGVTEAMNKARQLYGEKRLVRRLQTLPTDIMAAINSDVAEFVGDAEQSDDLTLMVVTWRGLPQKS